jgi:hypothetical protein
MKTKSLITGCFFFLCRESVLANGFHFQYHDSLL